MEQSNTRGPLQTAEILAVMLDQLAGIAWAKLGLQPDPGSGTIEKDLPQARLAIDACERLGEILLPHLEPDDQRQIQNLTRDLKINFVEQSR